MTECIIKSIIFEKVGDLWDNLFYDKKDLPWPFSQLGTPPKVLQLQYQISVEQKQWPFYLGILDFTILSHLEWTSSDGDAI